MPEGDTIHRAARALHRALAGRTIVRFESVFSQLTRVDADRPLRGRTIERVTARGKHLLMWFSGGVVLRTHMRMNGSWHIYRPGERWRRPRHEMRIVVGTDAYDAVAFTVPVAAFSSVADVERELRDLGPDPLSETFDAAEAVRRLRERHDVEIADALLDQRAIAGLGNVFKSELLFAAGVSPFARVDELPEAALARIVALGVKFMRMSVEAGQRRTRGSLDRTKRLAVYGRAGQPCIRCGTPVSRVKQGRDARTTYWCENCQPRNFRDPLVPAS